ncbi:YlmH family RNA-binding protein [Anaerosporobacter faecicola]|uniref:YlmH family RNA-binding protein n=1 Tax=Anaerosporobacter faecicola TaxID=2718714 RepID=UPI00143AC629|nr:YlmH/Sll1252 family protein [Anaerosporobacter faecicola]
MTKEEELLCKRLKDMAYQTYNKGFRTYSDFLNLNEISLLLTRKKEMPDVEMDLYGGYEDAERKMVCFYHDTERESYERTFPIYCVKISPRSEKFCDDLSHRDYLGALLNLGIERYTIGDIIIKDKYGYVFCNETMNSYIIQNLTRIKHTDVRCTQEDDGLINITPQFKEIRGTVASIRLDAILSLAFNGSRSSLSSLITAGKVFINSRLVESVSHNLKEGDVVSVRGYGKFIYQEQQNQTKKGRYFVVLKKYC